MKAPLRVALGLVGAAVGAALIGGLLVLSRFLSRVRYFESPVPGVEWKHLVAFGVPFLLLAWVFVARRGATSSLVAVATTAVVVVGHAWSGLDWTVFVSRGVALATGGVPPAPFAVAFVAPFLLVALYHVGRRRSELHAAYAAKQAEDEDVAAVRRASVVHGLALLGGATLVAVAVAGAMLGAFPAAAALPVPASVAVAVGAGAIALVAVVGAAVPRLLALRARPRKTKA